MLSQRETCAVLNGIYPKAKNQVFHQASIPIYKFFLSDSMPLRD